MSVRISIHPLAQMDFDSIYAFIAERSAAGAQRWERAFEDSVHLLARHPHVASAAPEGLALERDLRQTIFRTSSGNSYRAIFIIEEGQLTILRIRGLGQDLLKADELTPP